MKQLRHSKFRNTGLLFELLIAKITSDTMNNRVSEGLRILKKHFKKNSQLNTELALYKALSKESFKSSANAFKLIEAVLVKRKVLDTKKLAEQKYNLNRDIKKTFGDTFYKARIGNYRKYATIHNLFEYSEGDNPLDYAINRENLIESLLTPVDSTKKMVSEAISKEDKEIGLLTYEILIKKFNERFNVLNSNQKNILREYIQSASNTPDLKNYVDSVTSDIRVRLDEKVKTVSDPVIKIKLTEIAKLTDKIIEAPVVEDNNILALLQYEELLKELN